MHGGHRTFDHLDLRDIGNRQLAQIHCRTGRCTDRSTVDQYQYPIRVEPLQPNTRTVFAVDRFDLNSRLGLQGFTEIASVATLELFSRNDLRAHRRVGQRPLTACTGNDHRVE